MAYDEHLADRIRRMFREHRINYEGKKMMGGICFLVNDKMCLGIDMDKDLEYWIEMALEYNPRAKSSKKGKKSG